MKTTVDTRWWDEFRGRCVACAHAHNNRRHLVCNNRKASLRGLPDGPGGSWCGDHVSKLYGCVYFESAEPKRGVPT